MFAAEQQGWELRRDRDGIQVHTRPVEGSPFDAVRTTTRMTDVRGRLRLTKAEASWNFVPQADGSVLVSNQAHINPGLALPGWVTNMLLIDAPFETMKFFVNEVRNPKYVDAQLSFIQEPAQ